MAEEILIAELRIAHDQMRRDMHEAARDAQRGSREIIQALNNINSSVQGLPQSFRNFNSELKDVANTAKQASGAAGGFSTAMNTMKGVLGAIGIMSLVSELRQFVAEMAKGGEAVLNLEARLKAVTGGIQDAAQAMAFGASEARRLAQDTLTAQEAFTQIVTAAEDTAAEGRGAQIIFSGFSDAITAAGKSGAEFGRIMNQVTQGMNKGKVQLEDLQVLAENGVPAQKLLAQALGITGEAFADAMQKGKVSAEAFILLGDLLSQKYREVAEEAANRLPGAFRTGLTKIKDEFRDLFAAIFESKELVKTLGPFITGLDIFPSRSEMTKHVDEFAKHLAEVLAIGAIIFDGLKKMAIDAFRDIASAITDFLAPVDTWIKKQFEKIPLPQGIKDFGSSLNAFLTEVGSSVESLDKKIEGMGPWDLLKNLKDDRNSLGTLTEIRKRLEEYLDVKGLGILDAKITGPAAQKSVTAIEKELELLEKTKDRVLGQINAPSKADIEKQSKEALAEQQKYADQRINIFRETLKEEERLSEQRAKDDIKMAQAVNEIKIKLAKDLAAEQAKLQIEEDIYADTQLQGSADPPMPFTEKGIAAAEAQAKRMQAIFENMGENIQENLADILTDVFRGQIDDIKDVGKAIVDIFARTAAEIATAMAIQPMVDKAITWLMGDTPGEIGGILGNTLNKISFNLPGGGVVTGGQIATGIGVAGASAGVGAGVSEATGGGMAGNILGGAAAGAMMGAWAGSATGPFAWIGVPLGAAIGAVVGALAGLTTSLIQGGKDVKAAIAPLTSAIAPTENVEGGVSRRGPFGFISLVDQSSNVGQDANLVATIIAEADAAIARLMTQRQRDIVSQALQGQHYALDAGEMDDAIAQAIQTRLFIAIRSLTDNETAINIVGEPYTGTAENIQNTQKRAAEALGILKMVEQFEIGPLGPLEAHIKALGEQFRELIDIAMNLGMGDQAAAIQAEHDRQVEQTKSDYTRSLEIQVTRHKDPALAAAMELEDQQKQIWADAVAAGAEAMALAQELFAQQWADHAAQYSATGDDVTGTGAEIAESTAALADQLAQFAHAGLSSTAQQLINLEKTYLELKEESERLGISTEELTASYNAQHEKIKALANANLAIATMEMTSPYEAAMAQWEEEKAQLQGMVDEEILKPDIVDAYLAAKKEEIEYQNAIAIASGNAHGAMAEFNQMIDDFVAKGDGLTQSARAINEVIEQFQNLEAALLDLKAKGLITQEQFDTMMGDITISKDNQVAEIIDDVSASMEDFANNSLSSFSQQLLDLERSYSDLKAEAESLGLSTDLLTQSYETQKAAIIAAAQQNFEMALAGVTNNPLSVALMQIAADVAEFQKLVDEGLIDQADLDTFEQASIEQARYTEAIRIATGAVTDAVQSFNDLVDSFILDDTGLSEAEKQIQAINEQADAIIAALTEIGGDDMDAKIAEVNAARIRKIEAVRAEESAQAAAELDAFTQSLENFNQGTMSSTSQQLAALKATFEDLEAEAIRLGQSTESLTQSYREQEAAIILAAQRNVEAAYLALVDPFGAAMLQIQIQFEEFQRQVEEGIIDSTVVDNWHAAAKEQAIWNEAVRISSGGASSAIDQFNRGLADFVAAGSNVSAVQQAINAVMFQFTQLELALIHLATQGAITEAQLAGYMADITASRDAQIAAIHQAERDRQRAEAEQKAAQRRAEAERRRAEAERRRQEAERERERKRAEAQRRREEAERERERKRAEAQRRREERAAVKESIAEFNTFRLSGPGKELNSLRKRFEDLREEARRLNVSVKSLTSGYKEQRQEIIKDARQSLRNEILAFVAPFTLIHNAIREQADEYRKMQREGILSRRQVDQWRKLATRDARFQQANAMISGPSTEEYKFKETLKAFIDTGNSISDLGEELNNLHINTARLIYAMVGMGKDVKAVFDSLAKQSLAIKHEAYLRVWEVIHALGEPFAGALLDARYQIEELQKLVAAGLVPQAFVDYASRLIQADTLVSEALRQISGSPVNSIGELANSFDEFIRAGSPLSTAGQEFYDLTETFINLADAAHLLGYSTAELEQSYLAQSDVIRERLLEDIENQLSAQIDAIESIDTYLDSLRLAAEQPLNLRLSEAQSQFQQALAGSDISEMISAAGTLRDIAREQYGSGKAFFDIEKQITTALVNIRSREQAIVDAERRRLTEQTDREIRTLQIGQSSLDQLVRVAGFGSRTAQGMDELLMLARISRAREEQTYALMERVLGRIRA